ncbi:peptidoglycan editing factor PgeF [Sulfurimonas sp.]
MQFYHSKLLNSVTNITHAFTTRESGNLAFHVNDNTQNVKTNHKALSKALKYENRTLVHMKQIHSDIVHVVNDEDNFLLPKECDALVTNKKNTPLMVMVADCSPILFYDKKLQVIAVAHAGRQGAFKNIIKNVIDNMKKNFNSKTDNILVSIGPSIQKCCYEVGSEIYDETKKLNLESSIQIRENSYYLDIKSILKNQLLACGIKDQYTEISTQCTCCNTDKYYSYRAENQTGRFAGIIVLK